MDERVEPPRPEEGGVDEVGTIGRREHKHLREMCARWRRDAAGVRRRAADLIALRDAVELGHQLRDYSVRDAARIGLRAARRRESIDLVEEKYARRRVGRALEELAHVRLRLSDVRRYELGPFHEEEAEGALGGDRLSSAASIRMGATARRHTGGSRASAGCRDVSEAHLREKRLPSARWAV